MVHKYKSGVNSRNRNVGGNTCASSQRGGWLWTPDTRGVEHFTVSNFHPEVTTSSAHKAADKAADKAAVAIKAAAEATDAKADEELKKLQNDQIQQDILKSKHVASKIETTPNIVPFVPTIPPSNASSQQSVSSRNVEKYRVGQHVKFGSVAGVVKEIIPNNPAGPGILVIENLQQNRQTSEEGPLKRKPVTSKNVSWFDIPAGRGGTRHHKSKRRKSKRRKSKSSKSKSSKSKSRKSKSRKSRRRKC